MTISEAIEKLKTIKDNANVDEYVKSILSCAIEDLSSYKNILGNIELDKTIKEAIESKDSRLACDTVDRKWASDLKSAISDIAKWHIQQKTFDTSNKMSKTNKKFIKVSCAIFVILAIAAASVAIYGVIAYRDVDGIKWPDIVSSIIGTVDFVFGIIAFVTERINDIKGKQVSNAASETNAATNDGDLGAVQQANKEFNNDKLEKKESEVINWLVLIGFVLSIIGMILFVVLTDKLPIKKFLMAGGILSGVVFMLVIGITRNKDTKVQNGESDENFNRED